MEPNPPIGARPVAHGAALAFTGWICVWVPVVLWAYGAANFLWLCNSAQFLLLYTVWRNDSLLASSQAGTVCLVGLAWTLDFAVGLSSGGRFAVFTRYMFDPELPMLARAVSLYHMWLPAFALWLVHCLGYHRRGPWVQTCIGAVAILGAWLLTAPERNINWVWAPFGMTELWLPQPAYVAVLLAAYPVLIYWPGHALVIVALRWLKAGRGSRPTRKSGPDRS